MTQNTLNNGKNKFFTEKVKKYSQTIDSKKMS